jgi:hypothetical protein
MDQFYGPDTRFAGNRSQETQPPNPGDGARNERSRARPSVNSKSKSRRVKWFYTSDGVEKGPLSTKELDSLYNRGVLSEDTLVRSLLTDDQPKKFSEVEPIIVSILTKRSAKTLLFNYMKKWLSKKTKPFDVNASRAGQRKWFAHTDPWNRLRSPVVEAVLDGFTDKLMLQKFVLASTDVGLVSSYKRLGRRGLFADAPTVIRAQISQILCLAGNRTLENFLRAIASKNLKAANEAFNLLDDLYELAVALANNPAALVGLAMTHGALGNREKCHDYAKRGLAYVAELRQAGAIVRSTVFPPDMLDQMERQLREFLN